jgi:hypothetical protein
MEVEAIRRRLIALKAKRRAIEQAIEALGRVKTFDGGGAGYSPIRLSVVTRRRRDGLPVHIEHGSPK